MDSYIYGKRPPYDIDPERYVWPSPRSGAHDVPNRRTLTDHLVTTAAFLAFVYAAVEYIGPAIFIVSVGAAICRWLEK